MKCVLLFKQASFIALAVIFFLAPAAFAQRDPDPAAPAIVPFTPRQGVISFKQVTFEFQAGSAAATDWGLK